MHKVLSYAGETIFHLPAPLGILAEGQQKGEKNNLKNIEPIMLENELLGVDTLRDAFIRTMNESGVLISSI